MPQSLVFVVPAQTTIQITCGSAAEIFELAYDANAKTLSSTRSQPLAQGEQPVTLERGLYELVSPKDGVSWKASSDVTSIVVMGGEDPWPIPPSLAALLPLPGTAEHVDFRDTARAYFGEHGQSGGRGVKR